MSKAFTNNGFGHFGGCLLGGSIWTSGPFDPRDHSHAAWRSFFVWPERSHAAWRLCDLYVTFIFARNSNGFAYVTFNFARNSNDFAYVTFIFQGILLVLLM